MTLYVGSSFFSVERREKFGVKRREANISGDERCGPTPIPPRPVLSYTSLPLLPFFTSPTSQPLSLPAPAFPQPFFLISLLPSFLSVPLPLTLLLPVNILCTLFTPSYPPSTSVYAFCACEWAHVYVHTRTWGCFQVPCVLPRRYVSCTHVRMYAYTRVRVHVQRSRLVK